MLFALFFFRFSSLLFWTTNYKNSYNFEAFVYCYENYERNRRNTATYLHEDEITMATVVMGLYIRAASRVLIWTVAFANYKYGIPFMSKVRSIIILIAMKIHRYETKFIRLL